MFVILTLSEAKGKNPCISLLPLLLLAHWPLRQLRICSREILIKVRF